MINIDAQTLLYTRTSSVDYRWVYIDNFIAEDDAISMQRDFVSVLKELSSGVNFPSHLFIRRLERGIAIYKVNQTRRRDNSGRTIFSLSGFSCSSVDALNVSLLVELISFDLLRHDKIRVNKIADGEKLERDFSYSFDFNTDATDDGCHYDSQTIRKKLTQFLSDNNGIGEGVLLLEENDDVKFEKLVKERIEQLEAQTQREDANKKSIWMKIKEIFGK